jgi:hypothetical protein
MHPIQRAVFPVVIQQPKEAVGPTFAQPVFQYTIALVGGNLLVTLRAFSMKGDRKRPDGENVGW